MMYFNSVTYPLKCVLHDSLLFLLRSSCILKALVSATHQTGQTWTIGFVWNTTLLFSCTAWSALYVVPNTCSCSHPTTGACPGLCISRNYILTIPGKINASEKNLVLPLTSLCFWCQYLHGMCTCIQEAAINTMSKLKDWPGWAYFKWKCRIHSGTVLPALRQWRIQYNCFTVMNLSQERNDEIKWWAKQSCAGESTGTSGCRSDQYWGVIVKL